MRTSTYPGTLVPQRPKPHGYNAPHSFERASPARAEALSSLPGCCALCGQMPHYRLHRGPQT